MLLSPSSQQFCYHYSSSCVCLVGEGFLILPAFKKRFEIHEPKSNVKMKELINKLRFKSSIVDVGSHVGDTGLYLAMIASKIRPDLKIIMIDPDKSKISFIEVLKTCFLRIYYLYESAF